MHALCSAHRDLDLHSISEKTKQRNVGPFILSLMKQPRLIFNQQAMTKSTGSRLWLDLQNTSLSFTEWRSQSNCQQLPLLLLGSNTQWLYYQGCTILILCTLFCACVYMYVRTVIINYGNLGTRLKLMNNNKWRLDERYFQLMCVFRDHNVKFQG